MQVAVIGNGIVGVCTAAWLQRSGHHVTFVDPLPPGEACSFGNAGSLSPSACLPVGMPGMWKKVPRWLLDPLGPLTIRWPYLPTVMPWMLRFVRHSQPAEVVGSATAMRELLGPIFECYDTLLEHARIQHLMRRSGCLYVYSSQAVAAQWQWGMDLRRSLGVKLRDVEQEELEALEPDLKGRFRFGILAPENGSTLDPSELVKGLHAQCQRDGSASVRQRVTGFERSGDEVRGLQLENGEVLPCDAVVIAGGAWSAMLTGQLGLKIPLETQRGYHVTVNSNNLALRHTVMAVEHNLMVNPMAKGLRLAGSVEFAGLQAKPNYRRAEVLLEHGRSMFPHLDTSRHTQWMGHRPCLPDSLPVIGAVPRVANAWCAFGHGHVGMCGGASTGREVARLVNGQPAGLELAPFSPARWAA